MLSYDSIGQQSPSRAGCFKPYIPLQIPDNDTAMKDSIVTVGAMALSLSIASLGTLPDSTEEVRSGSETLFTDDAPDDGANLDGRSIIGNGSAYGTASEGVLNCLEPPSSTLPRTGRERRNNNNVESTIMVRPTMTTEPLPPTKRDSSS